MTTQQIISSDETGTETAATLAEHLASKAHGWSSKYEWSDEHLGRVHAGQHETGKIGTYHAHPADSSRPARKERAASGAQSTNGSAFPKVSPADRVTALAAWMVQAGTFTIEAAAAADAPSPMSLNSAKAYVKQAATALAADGYAVSQGDDGWTVAKP